MIGRFLDRFYGALSAYFFTVWDAVRSSWPDAWEPETRSRLLSKVGIVCMSAYITDALVSAYDWGDLDISDPDAIGAARDGLEAGRRAHAADRGGVPRHHLAHVMDERREPQRRVVVAAAPARWRPGHAIACQVSPRGNSSVSRSPVAAA